MDDHVLVYRKHELVEGKGIGDFRYRNQSVGRSKKNARISSAKSINTTRRLENIKRVYRRSLQSLADRVNSGRITEREALQKSRDLIEQAFEQAYLLGVRASGLTSVNNRGDLRSRDKQYIERAADDEFGFWSKFIQEGGMMPMDSRVNMYARGLDSVYSTARVNGLPTNTILIWSGNNDGRTCESCQFLFENSPYTPNNLPTTPRAGDTLCLSNCRDYLEAVPATPLLIEGLNAKSKRALRSALQRIKRGG